MSEPKGQERIDRMVDALSKWQEIERKAMDQMASIMEKTSNPFIRTILEIIRNDSLMHHRVQQVLIDSMTRAAVSLTPEEIGAIWDEIEAHDELEKDVVRLGQELREDAWTPIQAQLLDYLVKDEQKHDWLLEQLGELKKGMYPYGG